MSNPSYAAVRKTTRYSLDVRARVFAGTQEITVRAVDISEGGVGVVSPLEIAGARSYVIEFVFPTMQEVFRAEIIATSKTGFRYGFRFARLDEKNMSLLRKYERRWGIHVDGDA